MKKQILSSVKRCDLCGAFKASIFLKAKSWNWMPKEDFCLVKCKICGLIYLNNDVHQENLNNLYSHQIDTKRPSYLLRFYLFAMGIFMWLRAIKIERIKKRGLILDVGCGEGLFLETMSKRGWQGYGVDILSFPSDTITNEDKITFLPGSLQDLTLPQKYFDVISFWHSFEHISEPTAVLSKARFLLKDDGILFISSPNIESLEARMNIEKWFGLELPAHCYHYVPSTLIHLLEKNGFKTFYLEKNSWEYNFPFFAQSFFNNLGGCYNLLQKGFKGYKSRYLINPLLEVYTIILMLSLLPFVIVLTILLYFVNRITRNGPVIEVFARKRR